MNREQLKTIIRKELEEHLYAHPSKHKGGFAHPGSQPHVKDAKKNAKKKKKTREGLFMGPSKNKGKTVNVRHKTSGKELVIQDNPATIKKYKKLGYTMWVGSRGKYESVNERMIQEHDKAKVLKAMLKAGSNKADAQALLKKHYAYVDKKYRDESASKKAEIIVTLAGTASEGTITEKQEADETMIKAVADLTQVNDHSRARYMAARYTGNEKLKSIYSSIRSIQETLGSLPKELSQFRSKMDKILKKELQKKVSNWEDVWGAL